MVYGEEAVRAVLSAEDRLVASDWPQAGLVFGDWGWDGGVTSTLVGPDSLNLLTGPRHGAAKRALAEAFSERAMRRHVPYIARVVQDYIARWAAGPQPLAGYAACQELSQALFDVVVLGGDGGRRRAAMLQELMARLQAGFQTPPLELPFTDYGKAVQARRAFGELVAEALAACLRRNADADADTGPNCALADVARAAANAVDPRQPHQPPPQQHQEVLLLSDSVVCDNMAAAFFGNASTGPSLVKALQFLAASPGVLLELRREQQEIVASHGTEITADVLDQMSYGAAVAKELLRITPAVPAVFRVALADFELLGRRIPKGWRVWCHLGDSVLKYNKDAFEPERWRRHQHQQQQQQQGQGQGQGICADTAQETASSASIPAADGGGGGCPAHRGGQVTHGSAPAPKVEYSLPFGTGVRTCLGRHLVFSELLVVLAVLARGYDWRALNPGEEWRVVPAPAPRDGLRVELRRREP
ncbi:hypothetical protein PLESTM_000009400 [Pleodorina starrii]|nr:hypothetical protein PLESTM_000009400 [Pleodorina starrii]